MIWLTLSDAVEYAPPALSRRRPACSPSWFRSSEPGRGANNIPRPAPSTVPASSPIRNEPPPSSRSKRSYSYAIRLPPCSQIVMSHPAGGRGRRFVTRVMAQRTHDDGSQPLHHADRLIHPVADRILDAIRGFVDASHRVTDRVIDAFGLLIDTRGHRTHVTKDPLDLLAHRGDLSSLQLVDEPQHAPIDQERRNPDADQHQRLQQAHDRHDRQPHVRRAEIPGDPHASSLSVSVSVLRGPTTPTSATDRRRRPPPR